MLNLKKLLTKILRRCAFSPIVAAAQRSTSDPAIALTTSNVIIGCPNAFSFDSTEFAMVSDGGIRVLKDGLIIAFAFTHTVSVNTGDVISLAIGSYQGGWKHQSFSTFSPTGNVSANSSEVFTVFAASAGDVVYARARNITAARGSIDHAKLVVYKLG